MPKFEVTYTIPTTGAKYHTRIVECRHQHEAAKIAQAELPSAKICGGGRQVKWILKKLLNYGY